MQTATDYYQQHKPHLLARTRVIKALAHPTRLFIVEELEKGERCVCDLTAMVGADISTVSKHLTVLKNAGIISDEKRGNCVYYTLQCRCVLSMFSCLADVIVANKEKMNEI